MSRECKPAWVIVLRNHHTEQGLLYLARRKQEEKSRTSKLSKFSKSSDGNSKLLPPPGARPSSRPVTEQSQLSEKRPYIWDTLAHMRKVWGKKKKKKNIHKKSASWWRLPQSISTSTRNTHLGNGSWPICTHRVTASQNGWGWKGPLEAIWPTWSCLHRTLSRWLLKMSSKPTVTVSSTALQQTPAELWPQEPTTPVRTARNAEGAPA